jgi:Fe-S-cluster containining protein
MAKENKKTLAVEITTENKCSFCSGSKCCSYITQKIETPRTKYDFEHMLWQISHDNINIYKDEDGWYLMVKTTCLHLKPGGGCGIYERRPQICRDHDNDYCEYDEPAEKHMKHYFDSYKSLRKYCKQRFKKWKR